MKFNFKKIAPICAGAILLGSTIGFAGAIAADSVTSYPTSFSNTLIVVGDSATADDASAALVLANLGLNTGVSLNASVDIIGASVSEDEIVLGGNVAIGDLLGTLDDSDVSSLLDEQISWDDGTGDKDYDISETISLGGLAIRTSLNDNDYTEPAMIVNGEDITYLYNFEDAINTSAIDSDNTITLNILGKDIEFSNIDLADKSVTVNLASEISMKEGEIFTTSGKTVTIEDIYEGSVSVIVDGISEIISKDETDTVNGVKIKVADIGYSETVGKSKAILKIGDELTKSYDNGDAFIGEDEDDPTWEWVITNTSTDKPQIGVTYSDDMEKIVFDDEPVVAGGAYVLPNNFAAVKLEGLNDVSRETYKVSFDSENLYNLTTDDLTKRVSDGDIVIIEGADDESIKVDSVETDKLALFYNATTTNSDVYAWDSEENEFLYVKAVASGGEVADLINEDTTISVIATRVSDNEMNLKFDNDDADGSDIIANIQGTGAYSRLGAADEDAESSDVTIGGTASGTKDNDIMDNYGTIVNEPEANADNDVIEISVPSEQVYAEVVLGAAQVSDTDSSANALVVKASTVNAAATTNDLIVIGGSAVNSVAAQLLGVTYPTYGDAWTAASGVGPDMALIKLYSGATNGLPTGRIALLVAGYEAKDTQAAAKYLTANKVINKMISTAGSNVTVTSL